MQTWQLQEAKGKFSEVVKRAQSQGPQNITVHGEPVAVLISRRDLKITREQTPTRKIKL
jgi:antitoxin Phd